MNVVEKMQALADEWHYGVERKGKGHVPYIEHPRAAARNTLEELKRQVGYDCWTPSAI